MDQFLKPDVAETAWYCARTQPKHEHIAARDLTVRLGLEVFNPRLRIERATRRGVVKLIEPLFPCYLFVRCHLADQVEHVRYATGISSLVHFGPKVPTVADEVIEDLRQCFEAEEPMTVQDPLRVGSEVTVADGSLLGSQGVVIKVLPAKQRVQVLLDFLGRTTVAEVDRKSLIVEDRSIAALMPSLAMAAA
jgi:transcriptional antiterminator RfaH